MNWVNFGKILLLAALSVLPLRQSPGQVTQNQRRTVAAANPKPAAPHKPANLPERWIEISIPSESVIRRFGPTGKSVTEASTSPSSAPFFG